MLACHLDIVKMIWNIFLMFSESEFCGFSQKFPFIIEFA